MSADSIVSLLRDWLENKVPDAKRVTKRLHIRATKKLIRLADGCLADWRDTLRFLSRIQRVSEGKEDRNECAPALRGVVDSFFVHLTRGCQPSLGHRMLASLADQLRVRVLLTTNFDDLIERAFAMSDSDLVVYDVHQDASLPPPNVVMRTRSLVKLHGGLYGLRADETLDTAPSLEDVAHFAGYVAGEEILEFEHQLAAVKGVVFKTAILIAGCSFQDERVLTFLRHATRLAWQHDDSRPLQIFWIGYRQIDREGLQHLSQALQVKSRDGKSVRGAEIVATAEMDAGLLLLELYQHLTGTIPPSGAIFPAGWNIPHPATSRRRSRDGGAVELPDERKRGQKDFALPPILQIIRRDGEYGELERIEDYYRGIASDTGSRGVPREMNRIWINLDSIARPSGLFLRMVLAMARIAGIQDPSVPMDASDLRMTEGVGAARFSEKLKNAVRYLLGQVARYQPGPWLIVVHAWDGLGTNALVGEPTEAPQRWGYVSDGRKVNQLAVVDWLTTLATPPGPGEVGTLLPRMHFLLLAGSTGNRAQSVDGARDESVEVNPSVPKSEFSAKPREGIGFLPISGSSSLARIYDEIEKWFWASDTDLKRRFLFALCCFGIARYPACFLKPPSILGRGAPAEQLTNKVVTWLDELTEIGFIRRKPGGFIWLNDRTRDHVRKRLVDDYYRDRLEEYLAIMVEVQRRIGRWYGRVLLASGDPLTAFLALRHVFLTLEQYLVQTEARFFPDSRVGELSALIHHGILVVELGRKLIESKLTEVVASRYLLNLAEQCDAIVDTCRHHALKELLGRLIQPLGRLRRVLIEARARVLEVQASFEKAAILAEEEERRALLEVESVAETAAPQPSIEKLAHLRVLQHGAISALSLRRYSEAEKMALYCLGELVPWLRAGMLRMNGAPEEQEWDFELGGLLAEAHSWLYEARPGGEQIRIVIQTLRNYCYILIHESQVAHLVLFHKLTSPEKQDALKRNKSQRLAMSRVLAEVGLELLRCVSPGESMWIYYNNCRLRTHLALVIARQCSWTSSQGGNLHEYRYAEQVLLDGEAYLEEFPLSEDALTRAVLDLRRAECRLTRFWRQGNFGEFRLGLWQEFTRMTKVSSATLPNAQELSAFREAERNALEDVDFGVLYDAITALTNARRRLLQHRRSLWWWQLLLVLESKALEFFVTALGLAIKAPECRCEDAKLCELPIFQLMRHLSQNLLNTLDGFAHRDSFQFARLVSSFAFMDWVAHDQFDCHFRLEKQKRVIPEWIQRFNKDLRVVCTELFDDSPGGDSLTKRLRAELEDLKRESDDSNPGHRPSPEVIQYVEFVVVASQGWRKWRSGGSF